MKSKDSKEKLYRIFDITTTSTGNGKVIVRSNGYGKLKLLSTSEIKILLSCQKFKTLSKHAKDYCRQEKKKQIFSKEGVIGKILRWILRNAEKEGKELPVSNKEIDRVLSKLQKWVEQGFLISETKLKQEIKYLSKVSKKHDQNNDEISVLGIPTCGRPQIFRRCLESFTSNFNQHSRTPDILVIDDSRSDEDQQKNLLLLQKLNDRYNGAFYHMNRQQRAKFGQEVAKKADVSPEVMQFTLMGHPSCNRSEGGCRNAFLLLSQGKFALQTDDDTICSLAHPPTLKPKLTITSAQVSDEYWFFPSYEEAVGSINFIEQDFLGFHEQVLGKFPGTIVMSSLENNKDLDVTKIHSSFLCNMKSGNAKVRMSLVGPVGDSCLFSDLYRLFLEGEAFRRLVYPAEAYPKNLSTRQIIRCVTQPTISDFPRCIGMNFAIDNQSLLPPFMPVQARCDGIFGDLLNVCFPSAYAGILPYVLKHDPPGERSRTVDNLFSMLEGIRVNDLISELIYSNELWPYTRHPEENLHNLGHFFMNLGNYSRDDFEHQIYQMYSTRTSRRLRRAEQYLSQKINRPTYWTNHMQKYIDVLGKTLRNNTLSNPSDIDNPSSDGQDFKHIVYLFGQLLHQWTDIYQAMEDFCQDEIYNYLTPIKKGYAHDNSWG